MDGINAIGTDNIRTTGEVLGDVGDKVSTLSAILAVPSDGATLPGVVLGEGTSLVGDVLVNIANFAEQGVTAETTSNLLVDVAFGVLPAPLENAVEKSGAEQQAKHAAKATIIVTTNAAKDMIKSQMEENND